MSLMQLLEEGVLTALQPLVGEGDGKVRQIQVEYFDTEEDAYRLVERHKPRMPAGFLNVPKVQHLTKGDVRAADANFSYGFIMAFADRASIPRPLVYELHDRVCSRLMYQSISQSIPRTLAVLDFVRPTRFEIATLDNVTGAMFEFDVGVRNWNISEPVERP